MYPSVQKPSTATRRLRGKQAVIRTGDPNFICESEVASIESTVGGCGSGGFDDYQSASSSLSSGSGGAGVGVVPQYLQTRSSQFETQLLDAADIEFRHLLVQGSD